MQDLITTKTIREINRKKVIDIIRKKNVVKQSTIIVKSGLSKQTINSIIIDLINDKIIKIDSIGSSTSKGGRKPMIFKFNPKAYLLAGMLLGENKIRCCITDLNVGIITQDFIAANYNYSPSKITEEMITLYTKTVRSLAKQSKKIIGLGIGLPGVADFDNGLVKVLTRHKGWEDYALKEKLQKHINVPIILDNEANVRALGEKWFGLGKDKRNFITVMIRSNGIGAGVIINEELFRGKNYIAGQIGHMLLRKEKSTSYLNYEFFLGQKYLNEILKDKLKKYSKSEIEEFVPSYDNEDVDITHIFTKFNAKNKIAIEVIGDVIELFGLMIANVLCSFDIELIIIHGIYSYLNDDFFNSIKEFVNNLVFPEAKKNFEIVRSLASKEMGLKGAASMVLEVVNI